MLIVLAQSKVVDLVLPEQPGAGSGAWWSVAAGLGIFFAAVMFAWFRRRRYDPAEAAFSKLARAAGLRRREVRAVRGAARRMEINKPVALLLSPALLRRAVAEGANGLEGVLGKIGAPG